MKKTFSVLFCLLLLFVSASAHAGRTDAAGGHWDRSSGTYHYHHGYPAHQHTNGICPYDYDDQTGENSDSNTASSPVQSSNITETEIEEEINWKDPSWEWIPDEYTYIQDFSQEYPIGSHIITRKYYYDDNGYMYTPYRDQNVPHGAVETDNSQYLEAGSFSSEDDKPRFDYFTLDEIVYQFGLQDQSLQFQEGALFGLNEAYLFEQFYQDENAVDSTDQKQYPYDRDDGTYETAYNIGYSTGCAELIELHSDRLPDTEILTGQLSASNRIDGATPLSDHDATFESAFNDGYYQSEKDFFSALNDLIVSTSHSDESEDINENESQSFSESQIWFPVALMSMLLALVIFIYYKSKEESTRS